MPELVPLEHSDQRASVPLDIRIRWHCRNAPLRTELLSQLDLPDGEAWRRIWRAEDGGIVVAFVGLARFLLNGTGGVVVCTHRSPGVAIRTVRHLVLDQLMPIVFNLRGRETLHSTAVAAAGGVVAFIGPAGSGKSTTAAAFCQAGFRAVADDCLSLIDNGAILAVPAYPGLRLWEDSVAGVEALDVGPTVAHYTPKRRSFAAPKLGSFPLEPLPLRRIYRVQRQDSRSTPRVEEIAPRDAMLELVQTAFQLDPKNHAALERQFRFMERVAQQVGVRRLLVPDGFEFLPRVRDAVLEDLRV